MRAAAALLVLVAALELAVLQVFLLPLRIGSVPVPLSIALAVAGNVGLTRLAYRATRSRLLAALPMLAWLVVVIGFALPRPEGDVIVSGSLSNIAFLGFGVCAAAYALGRVLATPAPPAAAGGGVAAGAGPPEVLSPPPGPQ